MGKRGTAIGPLGVVTLALLVERPMHPYEMYQLLIARGEERIVKVRPGSLYHTVDRLACQGLAAAVGTERAGNRPERTVYAITALGRDRLTERVAHLLQAPVNEYPLFPVAIAEAHHLSATEFRELLHLRLGHLAAERVALGTLDADVKSRSIPRRWTLDNEYLIALLDAQIAWVESTIEQLDSGNLDWDEPLPASLPGALPPGEPATASVTSVPSTTSKNKETP
jgi:DNA-binding PadR family transcriptional regulator